MISKLRLQVARWAWGASGGRRGWRRLAVAAVAVLLLLLGFALGYGGWQAERRVAADVPAPAPGPAVLILAPAGQVVASRGGFVGRPVTADALPARLVDAVLAIEDRRFFSHPGVDIRGVARALLTNLTAGGVREGGSTITQQLAKLDYAGSERSVARKLDELFLAWALEQRFSKREILARYLNRVYLGGGVYGVGAAARRYFDTTPDQLSLAQAAMLAGLIRAPSSTAPILHPEAAAARAAQVLDAMVATGAITTEAAAAARAAPAKLAPGADLTPGSNYFVDWVAEQAGRLAGVAADRSVVAQSTFDPDLQRLAEATVERLLAEHGGASGVTQAAMVVMSPDGAVRAMLGGRDYRASQFNRAAQARRQPGSTFKPFVYLAALEGGIAIDSTMIDGPVRIGDWSPENDDGRYRGPVTLETAFALSINTVAAQLGMRVGPERVASVAQRLGIASELRPTASLALGTSEVTLLELMGAYATIANDGRRARPYGLTGVQIGDGAAAPSNALVPGPIALGPAAPDILIAPAADQDLLRLMSGVIERGTGRAARFDRPAAGKTGTTQDFRDAWFIGFTRDLTVGVWLGNDDNASMNKVMGGGLPARIWHDFMVAAYATGRYGTVAAARPIVTPRAAPPVALVADRPRREPGLLDGIGRDLGHAANRIMSLFR